MEIPILIEPVSGNGYRAIGAQPITCSAEGATKEEALGKLKEQIENRLKGGAEIVSIELTKRANPWTAMAGKLKDNPLFDEWREAMAENRRKDDQEYEVQ
jgi:predicted RNase H-like HicB family nuclease